MDTIDDTIARLRSAAVPPLPDEIAGDVDHLVTAYLKLRDHVVRNLRREAVEQARQFGCTCDPEPEMTLTEQGLGQHNLKAWISDHDEPCALASVGDDPAAGAEEPIIDEAAERADEAAAWAAERAAAWAREHKGMLARRPNGHVVYRILGTITARPDGYIGVDLRRSSDGQPDHYALFYLKEYYRIYDPADLTAHQRKMLRMDEPDE